MLGSPFKAHLYLQGLIPVIIVVVCAHKVSEGFTFPQQ